MKTDGVSYSLALLAQRFVSLGGTLDYRAVDETSLKLEVGEMLTYRTQVPQVVPLFLCSEFGGRGCWRGSALNFENSRHAKILWNFPFHDKDSQGNCTRCGKRVFAEPHGVHFRRSRDLTSRLWSESEPGSVPGL